MKIKINTNNRDLWCLYSKERIALDEKYVEVKEDYLGEELIKTYKYEHLDDLVEEYFENYNIEPEILLGD